jgi:hypothetical protein
MENRIGNKTENKMEYAMEELVPIVGKLVEKYTAFESTSVTYETAEQLMGTVLYCIHEAESFGREGVCGETGWYLKTGKMPAQRMYELGASLVEQKVKRALALYNGLSTEFVCYGNHCLHDVFVKGMPEFFKWYDVKFNPQDTILTLDYPVLKDLSRFTGIDEVYAYLNCIRLEQAFLRQFPEGYVIRVASKRDEMENLCEVVLTDMSIHVLAGKSLSEREFAEEDFQRIKKVFSENDRREIYDRLKRAIGAFLENDYKEEAKQGKNMETRELHEYFADCVGNIVVRLKNAADNDALVVAV